MAVCSPALPLAQNIASVLSRSSDLVRSPGLHGWNAVTTLDTECFPSMPVCRVYCGYLWSRARMSPNTWQAAAESKVWSRESAGLSLLSLPSPRVLVELLLAGGAWKLWRETWADSVQQVPTFLSWKFMHNDPDILETGCYVYCRVGLHAPNAFIGSRICWTVCRPSAFLRLSAHAEEANSRALKKDI